MARNPIAPTLTRERHSRDIRALDVREVCSLRDWLGQYLRMELENPRLTDSKQLMQVLGHSSREYESDLGVFDTSER